MFKWLSGAKESVEAPVTQEPSAPIVEALPERPQSIRSEIDQALVTAQHGSPSISLTELPGGRAAGGELIFFRAADPEYIQGPHASLTKVGETNGSLRFELRDLTNDGPGVSVSKDAGLTWSVLPDGGKGPLEVSSGDRIRVGSTELEIPSTEAEKPWRLAAIERIEVLERQAPQSAELRDALYDFAMRGLAEAGAGSTRGYELARLPLERSLAVAEKLDDPLKTIEITRQLGMVELRTGNGPRAQELLERAESLENREAMLSEARKISERYRQKTE